MTAVAERAPTVAEPVRRPQTRSAVRLVALAAFVVYAAFSLVRYRIGQAGWDLAIFDQAVNHYAHLRPPYAPVRGPGVDVLGDHFSPALVLLAPLYWIWSDPRVLLLAQAALIASSVPIVGRFAARHLSPQATLAVTIAYAVGWPLQSMVNFDFHEVAFAVPLLALVVDALDRRDDRALLLSAVPLLLVREDMGLVLVMVAVVRLLQGRGRGRRWPWAALAGGGLAAYVVVTSVIVPAFSTDSSWHYWTYDQLGRDLPDAVGNVLVHPWLVAEVAFSPSVKVMTLLWLFAPLLFLPLRSPYVLIALPLLAERSLSSLPPLWTVQFHYSAPVWPVLFLAAIDGAARFGPSVRRRLVAVLAGVGLVLPALGLWLGGPYVLGALLRPSTYQSPDTAQQRTVLAAIPASTCVEADVLLTPHLTHRDLVSVPTQLDRTPDFLALRLDRPVTKESPSAAESYRTARAAGYSPVVRAGEWVLLRSPSYAGPSGACRPLG